MEEKTEKAILKAIKRVSEEFGVQASNNIKRMGTLAHQLLYFREMPECSQNMVIENLFDDMRIFGWDDWRIELKNMLNDANGRKDE